MNQGHPQYAAYAQPGPYDQPAYYAEQPVHRAPQQHMQYYAEQYVEQPPMQYAPQQPVPSPYQSDFAPPLLPPMMPPAMPQYPMSAGYAQQSYAQQSYDQVSYQQQVPVPVPQYQPIPSHQPQLMSQQMLQQQPMQPPQPIQPQQSQKSYTPPLSNGGKGKLVKPGRCVCANLPLVLKNASSEMCGTIQWREAGMSHNVLMVLCVLMLLHMCPHAGNCSDSLLAKSYATMSPHTTIYNSYATMSPHTSYYYIYMSACLVLCKVGAHVL